MKETYYNFLGTKASPGVAFFWFFFVRARHNTRSTRAAALLSFVLCVFCVARTIKKTKKDTPGWPWSQEKGNSKEFTQDTKDHAPPQ
jgi:hypothetical protein